MAVLVDSRHAEPMPTGWIESLGNLHCPTCDARLVAQGSLYRPLGRPDPIPVTGSRPFCPNRHALPSDEELVAYREQQGYSAEAPSREVPGPY